MPLQALVIAHACYGHNSFFKGNYLFRQWTKADAIVDYMVFARKYVTDCEERYGSVAVESVLDACHALMDYGVSRYHHPRPLSVEAERRREREREAYAWSNYDEIWRTLPSRNDADASPGGAAQEAEPQENLLYFVEKHSPRLAPWQRELVRIVRKVAQYFYPQGQTKVMNEGWATFWHYTLLNRLYDKGLVDDGFMIECLASHTNVVAQRGFDERGYGGFNPYALGFAMFTDIRRICDAPTAEDRQWFPDIAGGDWRQRSRLRDAQLQGRVLHRAVPVAEADSRIPPLRDCRPRRRRRTRGRQHPQRGRLPPRAQAARAALRPGFPPARHPGRRLRPATATAASRCATASIATGRCRTTTSGCWSTCASSGGSPSGSRAWARTASSATWWSWRTEPPARAQPVRPVTHDVGNCRASHFASPALTCAGFSCAIQCPEGTVTSVRFAQCSRIGTASLERTVSQTLS